MIGFISGKNDATLASLYSTWQGYRTALDSNPPLSDDEFVPIAAALADVEKALSRQPADSAIGCWHKLAVVAHYLDPAECEMAFAETCHDLVMSALFDLGDPKGAGQ